MSYFVCEEKKFGRNPKSDRDWKDRKKIEISRNVSKCLKVPRNVSKCLEMSQSASKCLEVSRNVSKCLKCLDMSRNDSKCLEMSRNVQIKKGVKSPNKIWKRDATSKKSHS